MYIVDYTCKYEIHPLERNRNLNGITQFKAVSSNLSTSGRFKLIN